MDLGCYRIDTELHDEFLSGSQFFLEVFLIDYACYSLVEEIVYLRVHMLYYLIDQSVLHRFCRRHIVIAITILSNRIEFLS